MYDVLIVYLVLVLLPSRCIILLSVALPVFTFSEANSMYYHLLLPLFRDLVCLQKALMIDMLVKVELATPQVASCSQFG